MTDNFTLTVPVTPQGRAIMEGNGGLFLPGSDQEIENFRSNYIYLCKYFEANLAFVVALLREDRENPTANLINFTATADLESMATAAILAMQVLHDAFERAVVVSGEALIWSDREQGSIQ